MYLRQSALLLAVVFGMAYCLPTDPPKEKVHRSHIMIFDAPSRKDAGLHEARMNFLNGGVKDVLGNAEASQFSIGSSQVVLIKNAADSELKDLQTAAEDLQGIVVDNIKYRIGLPSKPQIVPVENATATRVSAKDSSTCATRKLSSTYTANTHQLDLMDLHDGDGTYCGATASATKMNVFTLDTGIEKTHEGFTGLEINTYDADDGTSDGVWTPLVDKDGHGTHVAGIIASRLFGITPNVVFHAVKVLDDEGSGTTSTIIKGFTILENWLKSNPTKKATINMSVGGPRDTALERALAALADGYGDRVVFGVAAGNEATPACNTNLPSVSQVVAVGSVSASLAQSSFSNYGSCVDIYSVGEKIISTYLNNKYAILSGTSMATPVVVGVITQYWLQNPSLTGVNIRNMVFSQLESDIHAKGMLTRLSSGSPNKFIRYTCPGGCSGTSVPAACDSNPCVNGGTCSNGQSGYTCTCPVGTSGTQCERITSTACSSSPCQNRGSCTASTSGYTCTCQSGFTGTNCESVNPCASSPCSNGGSCVRSASGFTCQCPVGTSGDRCQQTTPRPCSSSPCLNGGRCTETGSTFQCTCSSGYTGLTCQTDINECASSPCQNGATCTDGVARYACACRSGYAGPNCETFTGCASNSCQNGGTCRGGTPQFVCLCPPGYQGTRCEQRSPCAPNPCSNGGTCTGSGNRYSCSCPSNYTGDRCQTRCRYWWWC